MLADQILNQKGREVATITGVATVTDALRTLREHNVGALVVSDDGETVTGILSERDIVRQLAAHGADALGHHIADLMKTEVVTCDGTADMEALMNLMTGRRFRHVPVVEDGKLTGIISIGDVVKARLDELKTTTEQLVDYIRTGR